MIKVSDRWDCLETWYTTISSVSLLEFICAEHHRQGRVQNKISKTRNFYLRFWNFELYYKVKLSREIWLRSSSSRPIITNIIIINTSWNSKLRKSCNFYENFGVCMLIRINLKVQRIFENFQIWYQIKWLPKNAILILNLKDFSSIYKANFTLWAKWLHAISRLPESLIIICKFS